MCSPLGPDNIFPGTQTISCQTTLLYDFPLGNALEMLHFKGVCVYYLSHILIGHIDWVSRWVVSRAAQGVASHLSAIIFFLLPLGVHQHSHANELGSMGLFSYRCVLSLG